MGQVVWTKRSRTSLRKIWEFYAENDFKIADKIIAEIISTAENIKFAEQFQVEEFLSRNHRRAIVRHFKIIYIITEDTIQVLQVFDTRQDPKKMK